ncbi:hypothetical protein HanOQP8_Chr07g0239941 [Helianthus annuus]|nr:hypothetical protein HanIR_Chr07g0304261 [Helianthus annuus]KAJ0730434.1 hypothetical protein HanOQP8_Chr07g0239941 [Helianthus annuus]
MFVLYQHLSYNGVQIVTSGIESKYVYCFLHRLFKLLILQSYETCDVGYSHSFQPSNEKPENLQKSLKLERERDNGNKWWLEPSIQW